MKNLIILILIITPLAGFSQVDEEKLWESAMHQVNNNNVLAFYTDVVIADDIPFNREDIVATKHRMYEKEGIFKVELRDYDRVMRVYHLEHIELETIKNFVLPIKEKIDVRNQVSYEF